MLKPCCTILFMTQLSLSPSVVQAVIHRCSFPLTTQVSQYYCIVFIVETSAKPNEDDPHPPRCLSASNQCQKDDSFLFSITLNDVATCTIECAYANVDQCIYIFPELTIRLLVILTLSSIQCLMSAAKNSTLEHQCDTVF